MKNRTFLLTTVAAVCLLAAWPRLAAAYIKAPPPTLGDLCRQATHISVLKVEKFNAENGVIVFKSAEQLKAKGVLPDGAFAKQVIGPNVKGAREILDWVAEGKTAVLFVRIDIESKKPGEPLPERIADLGQVGNVRAHVYIDDYWYWIVYDGKSKCWVAVNGEPIILTRYCGSANKLGDAVAKVLRGEEVVVTAMVGDNPRDLEQRRAKVQDLRASLQILGGDSKQNSDGDKKAGEKKPQPGEKKPGEKKAEPSDRKPDRVGTVKALSGDGKSFSLVLPATEKNKEPAVIDIQITEGTKINSSDEAGKLVVGQTVSVWFEKGSENVAARIQIGKPPASPEKKPAPDTPVKKPGDKKPEEPKKPREPAKPVRDPAPTAAVIDAEVDRHLATIKVPPSPQADDAEFLRRVTLDLTGRIPAYQQTVAFLNSKDPDKRRMLIDALLDSAEYGEHLGAIWQNLLVGRGVATGEKGGGGNATLRPWLAEQFNDNRGWNAIVTDLLTAEGTSRDNAATGFLLANAENGRPQPNKLTGSVAALFWGVNLRCAECHNHPFAPWKQNDFWGTAAFFGKVQYGGKGGSPALTESSTGVSAGKEKGQPAPPLLRGTAIVIPTTSGKSGGQVVKARFLGGAEPALDEKEPFRPPFAVWATAADNPYFARAAVNRMWAHFFGRGFVYPLDAFDTRSPSHPELLDRLAKEFAASGFDLKHLARCITTSKAYQRTHRPVPGNEADTVAFSHMTVKVLTPEVLYDALGTIGKESGNIAKNSGNTGKGGRDRQESRDVFLRSFRIDDDANPTEYIQGIPQLLRLMNGSSPNRGAALIDRLCSSGTSRPEAIETLYLTVLSRRPMTEEVELMSDYLSRRKDNREGYRGVLWILLNSSEFALNH